MPQSLPELFSSVPVFIKTAIRLFLSFDWITFHTVLKYIFIILDIALVIAFVLVFPKTLKFRPKIYPIKKPRRRLEEERNTLSNVITEHWKEIEAKSESSPPDSLTLAVIEADNLVDSALKDLGIKGEHMADRLEQLDISGLKSLNRLWEAHRVRNQIVHTPGFVLSETEARRFLDHYRDFLKEVGLL